MKDVDPKVGGSYLRDPQTGELVPAPQSEQPAPEGDQAKE